MSESGSRWVKEGKIGRVPVTGYELADMIEPNVGPHQEVRAHQQHIPMYTLRGVAAGLEQKGQLIREQMWPSAF